MAPKLTRRSFLKAAGASAAGLAAGANFLPGMSRAFAAPARQDAVQISFMGWGGVAEDEGVQAAIEAFQEEMPGITVEWIHGVDTDWTQMFLSNIAAGTPPDTSFIASDTYETFRQQGLLMDITDRIAEDELLGQEDYFIQPQETARAADDEGRWHGIGSCWVAPHIYYNADIFDEAGITPPGFKDDELWEWDQFLEIANQLTTDVNGRHPNDDGFDPDNIERWAVDWPIWWVPVAAAVFANGGAFVDPNEPRLGLDSPEAIEAIQRLADLRYLHHVAPQSAALSTLGMTNTQMLDTGRLAMAVDGSWALSWMKDVTIPLGTGALPKMAQAATFMQAHFHSALASTPHPEEAWQWVRFLATPFYQTQFLKIGLWLPSQTALLSEEGLSTWITEGIHPANYVDFVTEYLPQYGVTMRIPPGYVEGSANFINPAFDAVVNGTPAEEVMPDAVQQANDVIAQMVAEGQS
jgi:multiple sugar transport system substrate-binding protein